MNPQCIICHIHFKPSDYLYSTYCGHVFHYHCLSNWLGRSPTCPQCRQQTNNQQMLRLWLNDGGLNTSFTDEVSELKKGLETKVSEIEKKSQEIKKLEDDIKQYRDDIYGLRVIIISGEAMYDKKLKDLESQRTSCEKKLKELEVKLFQRDVRIAFLEDDLESQRDSYEQKIRNWQSKYDRYRYEMENDNYYSYYY